MKTKLMQVSSFSLKLVKDHSIKFPVSSIRTADHSIKAATAYLQDKDCEHVIVLMTDGNMNLIGAHTVSIGSISGASMKVRDCFKAAIIARASNIILAHNHPSNSPAPSKEDIEVTKNVIDAGKLLGIPMVDHIIVSSGLTAGSFSFSKSGMLGL